MRLHELKSAVSDLRAEELTAFAQWFEEYFADAWDRRSEAEIKAGRLDEAGRRADAEFEAGHQRLVVEIQEARRMFAVGQRRPVGPDELMREIVG